MKFFLSGIIEASRIIPVRKKLLAKPLLTDINVNFLDNLKNEYPHHQGYFSKIKENSMPETSRTLVYTNYIIISIRLGSYL